MDHILPLRMIDDSELFEALQTGTLKGPNAVAFDANAWLEAVAKIPSRTERDRNLLDTALFLGRQFSGLRAYVEGRMPKLSPSDAVDFVVAGTNFQTITVLSLTETKLRRRLRASEHGSVGDGADIRVRNTGKQQLNPDDLMAVLVDSLANLLFHVSEDGSVSSEKEQKHALARAQFLMGFASVEHGLKQLWNRAVWEGCTVKKSGNGKSFVAQDEAFEKLWLAWQRRFEALVTQEGRLKMGEAIALNDRGRTPPVLERSVVGFDGRDGYGQDYIVGKAHSRGFEQVSALGAVEASYLRSFIDEVLPDYEALRLTYRDLWRAWWVLQDIAMVHQARMPKKGVSTWRHVGYCAMRFSVQRATKAIAEALGLPLSAAEAVMEVFTVDPSLSDRRNATDLFLRGAWGRPVLRSPEQDCGRILLASLLSPNPILTMERWMTRTGMADELGGPNKKSTRGKVFERSVVDKIRSRGAKNSHLSDFHASSLPACGVDKEEIDLIFRFGSTIGVCEVKCFNVPFEPADKYNHLKKLSRAAEQANRKVSWARLNRSIIFDLLSVSDVERDRSWRLVPIVVLNTPYGAGLTLNGCAITDIDWMSTFICSPEVVVSGVFVRGVGTLANSVNVYRDQMDLERRLTEVAVSPPSLASELSRIVWDMVPFPTESGEPLLLRVPVSKGISFV